MKLMDSGAGMQNNRHPKPCSPRIAPMNVDARLPPPPAVAVILVNWNGWRDAVECIGSVLEQSHASLHIFLVDNDSRDDSVGHIGKWCATPAAGADWRDHDGVARITDRSIVPIPVRIADRPVHALPPTTGCRVTLIRSGGNLGFAGGCNVGIRAAGLEAFEFFWLLNTDTVVHRDALAALVRRAQTSARVGMVGSTIRYYHSPNIIEALAGAHLETATITTRQIGQGRRLDERPIDPAEVEREMSYVAGASMLVSGTFVREVGFMQEDYFLYCEELDWAMRGRDRFTWGYAPDSHVFHKSGASSSKVMPAFTANLYYRNQIRFAARFFPRQLPAVRRRMAVELLRHTVRGRWIPAKAVAAALRDARKLAAQIIPPAA
jgi:GT2 family glycosyltransferase